MLRTQQIPQGWNIVVSTGVLISLLLAAILLTHGFNEQALMIGIRATARTSCILFVAALIASRMRRIWQHDFSQWLSKNRRYFGLAFALSHGFHALTIIVLAMIATEGTVKTDHGGTLGYLFIILMTITSFRITADWLGDRLWRILHTVGMYYLWLAFIYAFSLRLFAGSVIYFPFWLLLVFAIILRLLPSKILRTLKSR